jgi:two-component system response regulator FixJ
MESPVTAATERHNFMEEVNPVIYIVDDSEDNVTVYSWMLSTAGFETRTFLSGVEFLKEKDLNPVGCILLDNQMPELSGLDVQRKLIERGVNLPVVFMSGASTYSDVVEATRKGAHGFLEKPFHKAELLQQINAAVESSRETPEPDEAATVNALSELLTRREYEVCELIIAGNTNRSIADELGISVSTVEFHRANLMDKLQVNSLAELIKLALKLDS